MTSRGKIIIQRSRTRESPRNKNTESALYARIILSVLLALIALFNLKLAPEQLATTGWFGTVRQPRYGLFGLCLAAACAAVV
jgi:hypothetical protein